MSRHRFFRVGGLKPMIFMSLALCIALFVLLSGCRAKFDSANTPPVATRPYATSSPPASLTAALDTLTGDLADEIRQMEKNMPAARSGRYERPTATESKAFFGLVASLQSGDMVAAAALASEHQYALVQYRDTGGGDGESWLLRETIPVPRGWGLYALREQPENHVVIEAPHPLTDRDSAYVALDLYRALTARALLVAGAHRDANRSGSADVAHVSRSIFQAVHAALVDEAAVGSNPILILQVHGFAADKHPGYPSVVLGTRERSSADEISLCRDIAQALVAQGIPAGVCEKNAWNDLCGTQNVQGSTSGGAVFIHLELNEAIRANDRTLVVALGEVLLKR